MSQKKIWVEAIPQIFSELNQLAHVQLEYSATLKSYKVITKLIGMVKESIEKEICNRTEEIKIFSTEQGIGLRKILLEHYQRLSLIMNEQYSILDKVTSSIYHKHKSMENSLNFIEPVVKDIEHKTKVLQKQLTEIHQKVAKFEEIKNTKLSELIHSKNFFSETTKKASCSQIFPISSNTNTKQTPEKESSYSVQLSLFSLRKFDKLETESQFDQVQTFLELKCQEVQQFVRIEKELTEKTVQKIYEIFQQILGKGLENLEIKLLNQIRSHNIINPAIFTPALQKNFENPSERDSESSTDLQCYEKIEELFENPMNFEKIKRIKKRLYQSIYIGGVDITESIEEEDQQDGEEIEVSPTFNCVSPLIFESYQDVNQFTIKSETIPGESRSIQKSRTDISPYHIFDSFSKENFNTMNN